MSLALIMADLAPMWPGSPDWPSSRRTHLLPMSAAHVLNNCNDKLATAKLGPNSIADRPRREARAMSRMALTGWTQSSLGGLRTPQIGEIARPEAALTLTA